jgi:type II secretory pathway pseudopilin PulG
MFAPGIHHRVCVQGKRAHPSSVERRSRIANHSVRTGFSQRKQRDPESVRGFTLPRQREPESIRGFTLPKQRERASAFTLLELLIVVGIIGLLLVLIAPAFTNIKGGTDVTSAAYTIQGVLDTARTYAKANNTYTWVGFYEEDGSISSTNPPTPGNGRVVVSIVASKDGTEVYTSVGSPAADMDTAGTRLSQVGKLVKLDNMHLRTFANCTSNCTGDTFPTRPPVPGGLPNNAKIGDMSPPDSLRYFHYPPTATEAAAQYTFKKMIQFSPRGECRPQNDNYELRAVIEVGFQPIHGTVVDDPKNCAVQLTGFGGNTKIYQR